MYLWFTVPVEKNGFRAHNLAAIWGDCKFLGKIPPKKMSEINTGGSLGERMVTGRNWYGGGQGWRASVRQCRLRQREFKVGGDETCEPTVRLPD